MFTLTITASNAEEFQFHVNQLARVFKETPSPHADKKVVAPVPTTSELAEGTKGTVIAAAAVKEKKPAAKKAAKPVDPEPVKAADPVVAAPVAEAAVSSPYPTADQAMTALKSITDQYGTGKEGLEKVKKVLAKIGRQKISEVSEEQRSDLIKFCALMVEKGEV